MRVASITGVDPEEGIPGLSLVKGGRAALGEELSDLRGPAGRLLIGGLGLGLKDGGTGRRGRRHDMAGEPL